MLTCETAGRRRAKPPKSCAVSRQGWHAPSPARPPSRRERLDAGSRSASAQWQPSDTNTARADATIAPASRSAANVSRFMRSTISSSLAGRVDTSRVNTTDGDEARRAGESMPKSVRQPGCSEGSPAR
jgi:hypothetical protein